MRFIPKSVLIAATVVATACAYAQDDVTPVIGQVLAEPRIAEMSDGAFCVNYELVVANAASAGYTLDELRVVDPAKPDVPIKTMRSDEIASHSYLPGAAGHAQALKLLPAQSGYIRINLTFDAKDAIPGRIEHIVTATADAPIPHLPQPSVGRIGRSTIVSGPAVVIGPPVRGANWVAAVVGGEGYHRNTVMPVGGAWVAPERWAVDWVQLAGNDRLRTGPLEKNESYPQYGRKIIAVADGTVESVRDGMPDIPAGKGPDTVMLQEAAGNYIVQDIGSGFYALYAHLQPGSVLVRKGDVVKKGQVLALLGNSGNTTGPHLHFHVIHGPSPLGSDGVPYVIDSFTVRGNAGTDDAVEAALNSGGPVAVAAAADDGQRAMKMPRDVSVVDFR